MIAYTEYKELVNSMGGSRPFNSNVIANNYFVYFNHRVGLYMFTTVNDGCQAPERIYMDNSVALKVRNELNRRLHETHQNLC